MLQWWVEFDDELSWLFTNRFSATRKMKVKRMSIAENLRRIWLFSTNKIKSSESFIKQPTHHQTQLIIAAHDCYIRPEAAGSSSGHLRRPLCMKNACCTHDLDILHHNLLNAWNWQWSHYMQRKIYCSTRLLLCT